jgi:hypothetical protein
LTYEGLEELRDAMRRPPWLLEPVNIWRAYKRLDDARVRGNSTRILTDIVMLVRFALRLDDVLEPLPAKVAGKFNLWLGREQRAGRIYNDEQLAWLTAVRDHLAVNSEVTVRDLQDVAAFGDKGGIARWRATKNGSGAVLQRTHFLQLDRACGYRIENSAGTRLQRRSVCCMAILARGSATRIPNCIKCESEPNLEAD